MTELEVLLLANACSLAHEVLYNILQLNEYNCYYPTILHHVFTGIGIQGGT